MPYIPRARVITITYKNHKHLAGSTNKEKKILTCEVTPSQLLSHNISGYLITLFHSDKQLLLHVSYRYKGVLVMIVLAWNTVKLIVAKVPLRFTGNRHAYPPRTVLLHSPQAAYSAASIIRTPLAMMPTHIGILGK